MFRTLDRVSLTFTCNFVNEEFMYSLGMRRVHYCKTVLRTKDVQ